MRDTFLLLWVGFLIIGVVGSIVSSIRKQIQAATPPAQRPIPPQWQPPAPPRGATPSAAQPQQAVRRLIIAQAPRPAPQPVTPKAPPPAKPSPTPAPLPHADFPATPAVSAGGVARLFRHRNAIVQAVIAAEVLGKPRAFNDEYFGA